MDRSRDPHAPQQPPGKEEGLGSVLWPPEAGSITSARSPPSRLALKSWAPPAGLGALSLAGPGMSPRVGHGALPAREALAAVARQPTGSSGCRHRACGREVPTVEKRERSVCSKLSTAPN